MIKCSVRSVIHVHVMLPGAKDFPLYLPHHLWFVPLGQGTACVSGVLGLFTVHTLDAHSALALR